MLFLVKSMYIQIYSQVCINRIPITTMLCTAFEILVVRAPGTTKNVAGQPKILMQLSDGQP